MKAQCYCRECQFITGGAPNNFIAMPLESFRYTSGAVTGFARDDLDKPVTREFCATCGIHIAVRPLNWPAVIVKVGTLDEAAAFSPDMAIFATDRQPYHVIAGDIPVYERCLDAEMGRRLKSSHVGWLSLRMMVLETRSERSASAS